MLEKKAADRAEGGGRHSLLLIRYNAPSVPHFDQAITYSYETIIGYTLRSCNSSTCRSESYLSFFILSGERISCTTNFACEGCAFTGKHLDQDLLTVCTNEFPPIGCLPNLATIDVDH